MIRARGWPALVTILSVAPSLGARQAVPSEVDVFMEKVLERREENRITLQSYVLDEAETFELLGPGRVPVQSVQREYTWYVRDGYLIRSPVRFDGVAIGEATRREYEEDWLGQERRRHTNRQRQPRSWSRRSTFDNVTRSIERMWGRRINDRLTREIVEDARLWRDDMAAIVVAAGQILDDLGGVDDVGFGTVAARARDAFTMLESERLDRDEVAEVVTTLVTELVEEIAAADPEQLDAFIELVTLASRFEMSVPGVERAASEAVDIVRRWGMTDRAATLDDAHRALVVAGESRRESAVSSDGPVDDQPSSAQLQPRFVSEAYFMDFPFEPGNYFFAGREVLSDRSLVKVEYYPEQLFSENSPAADTDRERDIQTGFEKTSLVTLWIDPDDFQIVKFTFDNVGFEFLPLRWLVRLDDLQASMVMGQPIDGVWLPERIDLTGQLTTANGSYAVRYERTFSEYRQADVRATIRSYDPPRD